MFKQVEYIAAYWQSAFAAQAANAQVAWDAAQTQLVAAGVNTPLFDLMIGGVLGALLVKFGFSLGGFLGSRLSYAPGAMFTRTRNLKAQTDNIGEFALYALVPFILDSVVAVGKLAGGVKWVKPEPKDVDQHIDMLRASIQACRRYTEVQVNRLDNTIDELPIYAVDEEETCGLPCEDSDFAAPQGDTTRICIPALGHRGLAPAGPSVRHPNARGVAFSNEVGLTDHVEYYSDNPGVPLVICQQKADGRFHGTYVSFHPNGKVDIVGQMREGKRHGKWNHFNGIGEIITTWHYSHGLLIKEEPAR